MASLQRNAASSLDVATSLLIQCRIAHQELQRVASKETKFLNRLCEELHFIRNEGCVVPQAFEVALRTDSEMEVTPFAPPSIPLPLKEADPFIITVHDELGQVKELFASGSEIESSPIMKERHSCHSNSSSAGSSPASPQRVSAGSEKVAPAKRHSVHSTDSRKSRDSRSSRSREREPRAKRSFTGQSLEVEDDMMAVQSYSINGLNKKVGIGREMFLIQARCNQGFITAKVCHQLLDSDVVKNNQASQTRAMWRIQEEVENKQQTIDFSVQTARKQSQHN